jgi:hypothetical protein
MYVTGKYNPLILLGCLFCLFCTAACAGEKTSSLTLDVSGRVVPLIALNKNAQTTQFSVPSELSGYAYFAFPPETVFDTDTSLAVTLSGAIRGELFFLYPADFIRSDFRKKRTLNKKLAERPLSGGVFPAETVTLSMAFPGIAETAPVGFAVYMEANDPGIVSVVSASVVSARYGWSRSGDIPWFGFSDAGGSILEDYTVFDIPPEVYFGDASGSGLPWMTVLELAAEAKPANGRIRLVSGDDTITIRCAPGQKQAHLSSYLFSDPVLRSGAVPRLRITEGHEWVTGITAVTAPELRKSEGVSSDSKEAALFPIRAEPGLALSWPQENWRQRDFELFSWEQFPAVLIFDFLDYRIQDRFLKRLSFFTEKKGFTGRLAPDSEIASLHGYNAHDYRAESLAAFFALAEEERFPLNEYELLLKDILLEAGIIRTSGAGQGQGTILPGEGAIISISRESPDYLRAMLLPHEAFHGIYFVDSGFRQKVSQVYAELPEQARAFLAAYFGDTPTLNYDTSDTYLMENGFMAYIMQQTIARIPGYFSVTIADRVARYRGREYLAEYVKNTNAADFVEAARKLEAYTSERWGYAPGRMTLFSR